MTVYTGLVDASNKWNIGVPSSSPLVAGTPYRRRQRQILANGQPSAWSDYVPLIIPVLDPDAAAYFGAFTTAPSPEYRDDVNNLIIGLKADGLWALALNGGLYDYAGETDQAARINMRKPTQVSTFDTGYIFKPNWGVKGDGIAAAVSPGQYSAYPALTTNNGTICWVESENLQSGAPIYGDTQGGDGYYAATNVSATQGSASRFSAGTSGDQAIAAPTTSEGFGGMTRLTSASYDRYIRGAATTFSVVPTGLVGSRYMRFLAGASSFSKRTVAFGGLLSGLTPAQMAALRARLATFYARRNLPV